MTLLLVLLGTVMFLVEGPRSGFNSIPTGVYWAAVTMSTTGYGDLTPQTALGRLITGCAILLGYGIIAFPTGLLGAEIFAGVLQDRNVTVTGCRCSCPRQAPAASSDP